MPIDIWGEKAGIFSLTKTEARFLGLIKSRKDSECHVCDKIIPEKSYCLGSGYAKICLKCAPKFLKNFIDSLEIYKSDVGFVLKDLKDNNDKYIKNNMLANLEK